jgi:hypothetical protein
MNHTLERRAAQLNLRGEWTADDLTDSGVVTLDPSHEPNAGQNGIGAFINGLARRGLIVFTGRVIRSTSPARKGGGIRVWAPTEAGVLWARNVLDSQSATRR